MKNRNTPLRLVLLFALAAPLFMACNPSRKMQRYMYLVDDKPATELGENTNEPAATPAVTKPEPRVARNTSPDLGPVVKEAEKYLGTPYKYGGTGRSGLDCSALTQNAYSAIGKSLPRSSFDQSKVGQKVNRKEVQPGDLVFFDAKKSGKISHVGMVVHVEGKNVKFIHATTSKGVRYDQLGIDGYWDERFVVAKRPE